METNALIAHILARYHDTHRRELPELLRLAARVEQRHVGHAQVPAGLHAHLEELAGALDEHLAKEEQILFPLMMQGGHPMITSPIGRMRFEHDEHGERLARLEALTHGLEVPDDDCPTWRALYTGLRKLVDDVHDHVHLENNVLFPRFV
jgi:regulator of cell morphogenesis and NO signaling